MIHYDNGMNTEVRNVTKSYVRISLYVDVSSPVVLTAMSYSKLQCLPRLKLGRMLSQNCVIARINQITSYAYYIKGHNSYVIQPKDWRQKSPHGLNVYKRHGNRCIINLQNEWSLKAKQKNKQTKKYAQVIVYSTSDKNLAKFSIRSVSLKKKINKK